jgi:hypothetical protein
MARSGQRQVSLADLVEENEPIVTGEFEMRLRRILTISNNYDISVLAHLDT